MPAKDLGGEVGTMGLRELKKERTRQTVQQVAIRLFNQHGYAATTVEQIAAAAEISPATFYRYYSDKEDVVLSLDSSLFIEQVVTECPAEATLELIVQTLYQRLAAWFEGERELIVARYRLIRSVAELKGRSPIRREATRNLLCDLIAPRFSLPSDNYELRFAVAIAVAAKTEAVAYWAVKGGHESLDSLLTDAFHRIQPALKIDVTCAIPAKIRGRSGNAKTQLHTTQADKGRSESVQRSTGRPIWL
jgi:AcrR family transcriptional regulator